MVDSNSRPKSHAKSLQQALSELLESLGIESKVKRYQVLEQWPSFVGERVAEVSRPERLTGGLLFVKVKNSVWRNELLYLKAELIQKINGALGEEIVEDIRFI